MVLFLHAVFNHTTTTQTAQSAGVLTVNDTEEELDFAREEMEAAGLGQRAAAVRQRRVARLVQHRVAAHVAVAVVAVVQTLAGDDSEAHHVQCCRIDVTIGNSLNIANDKCKAKIDDIHD